MYPRPLQLLFSFTYFSETKNMFFSNLHLKILWFLVSEFAKLTSISFFIVPSAYLYRVQFTGISHYIFYFLGKFFNLNIFTTLKLTTFIINIHLIYYIFNTTFYCIAARSSKYINLVLVFQFPHYHFGIIVEFCFVKLTIS